MNRTSEPVRVSLTVWVTRISPGPASEATLAPRCTPARTSTPRSHMPSPMAWAHDKAAAGESNEAKKPSPAVSISRPRYFRSSRRTNAWWSPSSLRQPRSPSLEAIPVEPTMSVNTTVATNLLDPRERRPIPLLPAKLAEAHRTRPGSGFSEPWPLMDTLEGTNRQGDCQARDGTHCLKAPVAPLGTLRHGIAHARPMMFILSATMNCD